MVGPEGFEPRSTASQHEGDDRSYVAANKGRRTSKTEKEEWARRDLNPRPIDYESTALTTELRAHRNIVRVIAKRAKVNSSGYVTQDK